MISSPDEMNIKAQRLDAYRSTAYKYGIAAVVLALNNAGGALMFLYAAKLFSAVSGIPFEKGTPVYYFTVMLLNALSAYVFPTLLLYGLFRRERAEFIPDSTYRRIPAESLLLFLAGILAGSAGSFITMLINNIIDSFFGTGKLADPIGSSAPGGIFELVVFTLFICIVAPVCEEFIFRDLLLKPLRRFSDTAAVLVSGLIFGLYHGNFDQFAYAALMGVFYALIAVRANSVVPSIVFHCLNNLLVTLSKYLPAAIPEAKPFSYALSFILKYAAPVEIAALVLTAMYGCYKLHSHERFITRGESVRYFLGSPAVLIGLAVLVTGLFI